MTTSKKSAPIRLYTTNWCGDAWRTRRLLNDYDIPFEETNIEEDEPAAALVRQINGGRLVVPTLVFPDGTVLVEPSNAILLAKLGLQTDNWQ